MIKPILVLIFALLKIINSTNSPAYNILPYHISIRTLEKDRSEMKHDLAWALLRICENIDDWKNESFVFKSFNEFPTKLQSAWYSRVCYMIKEFFNKKPIGSFLTKEKIDLIVADCNKNAVFDIPYMKLQEKETFHVCKAISDKLSSDNLSEYLKIALYSQKKLKIESWIHDSFTNSNSKNKSIEIYDLNVFEVNFIDPKGYEKIFYCIMNLQKTFSCHLSFFQFEFDVFDIVKSKFIKYLTKINIAKIDDIEYEIFCSLYHVPSFLKLQEKIKNTFLKSIKKHFFHFRCSFDYENFEGYFCNLEYNCYFDEKLIERVKKMGFRVIKALKILENNFKFENTGVLLEENIQIFKKYVKKVQTDYENKMQKQPFKLERNLLEISARNKRMMANKNEGVLRNSMTGSEYKEVFMKNFLKRINLYHEEKEDMK